MGSDIVTRYNINGFVEDLQGLNVQRRNHGCTHFKNNQRKQVTLISCYLILHLIFCLEMRFNFVAKTDLPKSLKEGIIKKKMTPPSSFF